MIRQLFESGRHNEGAALEANRGCVGTVNQPNGGLLFFYLTNVLAWCLCVCACARISFVPLKVHMKNYHRFSSQIHIWLNP